MVLNVLSNYGMNLVQKGGAKAIVQPGNGVNFLVIFAMALLSLFVRAWLVQMTYNSVGPKLAENYGADARNFRPLTLMESVFLVILIQNLVN